MSTNDWKSQLGVVYSTNPDFEYKKEESDNLSDHNTIAAEKQLLRISLDRRQRAGKKVTLVTDFRGSEEQLKELGKMLKSKCGVGGSVKENEIIIQGDFREKIQQILIENGYKKSRII